MRRIVIDKFRDRKLLAPVVLLVVEVDSKVLFEGLIGLLGLTVGLGVIGGGQIRLNV